MSDASRQPPSSLITHYSSVRHNAAMRRFVIVLCLALGTLVARAQSIEVPPTNESGRVIKELIEKSWMDELRWPDFSDYRKHLRNFYSPNGYELAGTRDGQPTSQARKI